MPRQVRTGPVVIEVRNRVPTKITYAESGAPVVTDYFQRYDTVNELFDDPYLKIK